MAKRKKIYGKVLIPFKVKDKVFNVGDVFSTYEPETIKILINSKRIEI
jgi:hypothetical protein